MSLSTDKKDKPRLFNTIFKQFPRAIKAVAERSEIGHIKYAEIDQEWEGFLVTPLEQYRDALVRHLMCDGEEETELDHLKAVAWNAIAILEIKLRENEKIT